MSETPGTELASEYSARIAQDLEVNAREQDRLATEIAALEEQLRAVRENRVVLERLQQALTPQSSASASSIPAPAPAPAAADADTDAVVPHQRTEPAPDRRDLVKPGPAEAKPSLVEAVHAYLAEQREPRSATDVAEAIRAAQPGRTIKTTVIRTTLENLVARNRARRTKQGRAVFYTLVTPEAGA
ncbi:MAG: hypothetical protein JF597_07835 [Streptomyces sp.]|jgi:hypothetical protein|uniref:hypothetical protein n=1 Tax=Streptomyces sp. TaxID=1931 RepID=UPI0025F59670|nr:hypothetical protein [Streptomyces sp.]MBW8793489.1 hypothetical protein [Streptomyces sp.]